MFSHVAKDGKALKERYPKMEDFLQHYAVDNALLEQIVRQGEQKGVPRDAKSLKRWERDIRARIKAEVGNMLYETSAFYAVMLPFDQEVKEAVGILNRTKGQVQ